MRNTTEATQPREHVDAYSVVDPQWSGQLLAFAYRRGDMISAKYMKPPKA